MFLTPVDIPQIFNPIAELVIPIGIPIKEAKGEMEAHPVIVEALWYRRVVIFQLFQISILTKNSAIFFNVFSYWKYFSIILSFLRESLGKNKFVFIEL